MIDMASKNGKFKKKIIAVVKTKFGSRFNIEEKPFAKVSPNIILSEKVYNDPIFDMFILEPKEDIVEKLKDWKPYINKSSEKHYILVSDENVDQVSEMIELVFEDISIAIYKKDPKSGKITEVIYG